MSAYKILVVDIDGTLANVDHRVHHVRTTGKKNWSAFFAEAKNDESFPHIVRLVKMYKSSGHIIVLCTGRPANLRDDTHQWLTKMGIPYDYLLMRLTTERGPDYEVKPSTLLSFLHANNFDLSDIELILEDRLSVANAWRVMDIPVLVCGDEWR